MVSTLDNVHPHTGTDSWLLLHVCMVVISEKGVIFFIFLKPFPLTNSNTNLTENMGVPKVEHGLRKLT